MLLMLVEYGFRYTGRRYRSWPPGVEGQVRNQFADLVFRYAIGQRTSEMAAELLRAI